MKWREWKRARASRVQRNYRWFCIRGLEQNPASDRWPRTRAATRARRRLLKVKDSLWEVDESDENDSRREPNEFRSPYDEPQLWPAWGWQRLRMRSKESARQWPWRSRLHSWGLRSRLRSDRQARSLPLRLCCLRARSDMSGSVALLSRPVLPMPGPSTHRVWVDQSHPSSDCRARWVCLDCGAILQPSKQAPRSPSREQTSTPGSTQVQHQWPGTRDCSVGPSCRRRLDPIPCGAARSYDLTQRRGCRRRPCLLQSEIPDPSSAWPEASRSS